MEDQYNKYQLDKNYYNKIKLLINKKIRKNRIEKQILTKNKINRNKINNKKIFQIIPVHIKQDYLFIIILYLFILIKLYFKIEYYQFNLVHYLFIPIQYLYYYSMNLNQFIKI